MPRGPPPPRNGLPMPTSPVAVMWYPADCRGVAPTSLPALPTWKPQPQRYPRCQVRSRVGDERWQQRAGEVGMVQKVEEFGAQLHLHALADRGVLVEREVPLLVRGSHQRIASQVSIVPRARYAVGSEARKAFRCWCRAWQTPSGRGSWLDCVCGRRWVRPRRGGRNHRRRRCNRPRIVVQREGLAALQRHRAIEAPAILQTLHAPPIFGSS